MSMKVDLSTPLTEDERAYLHMRGRLADIERADNMFGAQPDVNAPYLEGDGTGPEQLPVTLGEQASDRKRRLLAELAEIEETERAGSDEDEEEDLPPYEQWKVKDLDAELKERGLPGGGSQADKAQRLRADDEAQAAANASQQ